MRCSRLFPGVLAVVLLAVPALPVRADQTFWHVSTAPVPSPAPASAAAGIDTIYYGGSAPYGNRHRGRHHRRGGRQYAQQVPRRAPRVRRPGGGIVPLAPAGVSVPRPMPT